MTRYTTVIEVASEGVLFYFQTSWSSSKTFRCVTMAIYSSLLDVLNVTIHRLSCLIYDITTLHTYMHEFFWHSFYGFGALLKEFGTKLTLIVKFSTKKMCLFGFDFRKSRVLWLWRSLSKTCLLTKYDNGTRELQLYVTDPIACGHAHQWFSPF